MAPKNKHPRQGRDQHPAVRRGHRDRIKRTGGTGNHRFQSSAANSAVPRQATIDQKVPPRRLQDRMTFPGQTSDPVSRTEFISSKKFGENIFKRSENKADTAKIKNAETAFWMEASHNASLSSNDLVINPSPDLVGGHAASGPVPATSTSTSSATTSSIELPVRSAATSVIQRVDQAGAVSKPSKFPVNPYKGKDPIKRLVQNKKLQTILSDKPIPKKRGKARAERPVLRMGLSKMTW